MDNTAKQRTIQHIMDEWLNESKKISDVAKKVELRLIESLHRNEGLVKDYHDYENNRISAAKKKYNQIRSHKNNLKDIQRKLRQIGKKEIDYQNFQHLLEGFEGGISMFKSSMSAEYHELSEMAAILENDILNMESKIALWQEEPTIKKQIDTRSTSAMRAAVAERNEASALHREKITNLDKQIATLGGRSCGWDTRDHDAFLRIWTQVVDHMPMTAKHFRMLRHRLPPVLPGYTPEDIDDHISRYIKFLELNDTKKKMLSAWQEEKSGKSINADQSEPEEIQVLGSSSVNSTVEKNNERSRIAAKQKVDNWKLEKARKEEEEKKKEEEKLHKQKLEEQQKFLLRQQENRNRLQQWKAEEEERNKQLLLEASNLQPDQGPDEVSTEEIQRRQERDLLFAKKKYENITNVRSVSRGRSEKIKIQAEVAVGDKYTSVQSKLLSATKASVAQAVHPEELDMAERRRASGIAHQSFVAKGGYDLKFSGRAIPVWRKALS